MALPGTAVALLPVLAPPWWSQGFLPPSFQPHHSAASLILKYLHPKGEIGINQSFRARKAYAKIGG